jgi:peptidoglycan/LPS O-acetylase OafA/YrhL
VYFLAVVVSSLFVSLNYLAIGDEFFSEVNRPFELIHDLPEQKEAAFFTLATLRHLVFAQSVGSVETFKLVFNGPLWSIVLEIYFYLAFPLLLLMIKPLNTMTRIIVAFIMGYLLQLWLIQVNLPEAESYDVINLNVPVYTNPFIRGIEFIFGMLLYKVFTFWDLQKIVGRSNWTPTILTVLLYVIVVIYVHDNIPYQYSSFFLVVPFVTIMIYALLRLQWHPANYIVRYCTILGGISYVLYSFHWPLMEIIRFYNLLPRMSFQFMQPVLVMLALLVVSYLIYRFVETPIRRVLYRKADQ